MSDRRWLVPFLNAGHLLDHLVMLVFPTVVLALTREWQLDYSDLAKFATGAFVAFGAFAVPAGWPPPPPCPRRSRARGSCTIPISPGPPPALSSPSARSRFPPAGSPTTGAATR